MFAFSYQELPRRRLIALAGGLAIVAGILVIAYPFTSLEFLAWVLGIWLIVYGVITVARASCSGTSRRPSRSRRGESGHRLLRVDRRTLCVRPDTRPEACVGP